MELKILAIDTSNHPMSIALVEDDRLMAQTTLNMVRNHSVYVLPTIERLMDDLGWTPADLNRVVVANGPGSYTGIRIATTTAKVLATTLGIDLVAESSLKVLATNVLPDDKRLIVPFFDARRGNVFAGGYQYQAGKLVAVMEDQHCAFSDLMVRVTQQPQGVLLIGQSTPKLADELAKLPTNVTLAPADLTLPSTYHLALLGRTAIPVADPDALVPDYLRLTEAASPTNPLLERANFLGITQSNVDEFFMVRVASLSKLAAAGVTTTDASGMTPAAQLTAVNEKEHQMVARRYQVYKDVLLPALEAKDIHLVAVKDLDQHQHDYLQRYFNDELLPVLTPMADDSSRPFPFISNNSLNVAVKLIRTAPATTAKEVLEGDQEVVTTISQPHEKKEQDGKYEEEFATVRVPEVYKRLVKMPSSNIFVLLDDVIKTFISVLFPGYAVQATGTYRVVRDMDLDVAEEDTSDLLRAVQHQLREREHGHVIRLEVEQGMDDWLAAHLIDNLKVGEEGVYRIAGPIDLTFLKKLSGMVSDHEEDRYSKFTPYLAPELDMEHNLFDAIREKDHLMQHPYDDFQAVVNFIHQAATDPKTLAIKMTLYRVSGNSPIIKYLGMAAQQGKQVTVLVEVKARFDEQNNVHWARRLERMGCHVIYGLVGLKTHCKLALVIRRDEDGIRRYMHLGTGNYNDVTANFYTDMGLFTCDYELGVDLTNLFNMLSGFARPRYFHKLRVSPGGIRNFINEKIDEQIEVANKGLPAKIRMKMNSLSDKQIIAHLYAAAAAGVKVELLIRGITCLRNDLPFLHGNITVHSIVGRFLEHSRIYYFEANGHSEIYLASADMMTRNLNRRVEELFPVTQEDTKARAIEIFDTMWQDDVKTRVLKGDRYTPLPFSGQVDCQEIFVDQVKQQERGQRQEQKNRRHLNNVFETLSRHVNNLRLKK